LIEKKVKLTSAGCYNIGSKRTSILMNGGIEPFVFPLQRVSHDLRLNLKDGEYSSTLCRRLKSRRTSSISLLRRATGTLKLAIVGSRKYVNALDMEVGSKS